MLFVRKEVGGCLTLTRCARIAASTALNDETLVSHLVTYVGIELLWQLKSYCPNTIESKTRIN